MRDQRSVIVEKTCIILVQRGVPQDIIDEVKMRLEIELAKCEVYERTTQLTVVDVPPLAILEHFLEVKYIEGKSENTVKRYSYELTKMLNDIAKPVHEITTNDMRLYLDYRKTHVNRKPLCNRTIENMRKIYYLFFAWLAEERIIEYNPMMPIHQIRYKKNVRKVYSQVDLQKLREACKTVRDIAMVDWLASTGCRIGEVAGTMLSMIDWDEMSCIVTGKGNRERKVFFDSVTAMHLKQYLNTRTDVIDALFINRNGKPITKSGIHNSIKRIGERAGVPMAHCHRFRHTLASNLVTKMPVTEVAEILGHDSITTTQTYCHNDASSVKADYRRATA